MASVRALKKKIHQQSFNVLLTALLKQDNSGKALEKIQNLSEELNTFSKKSIDRINASRGWKREERKAELKSINEQVNDKMISLEKLF